MPRLLGALACVSLAAAAITWVALSMSWPDTPVHLHVRWRADITDTQRVERERRFHLTRGVQTEAATWEYQLTDSSTANIRQLIQDAAVSDTAHLNRVRFRPEFSQDRSRQILARSLVAGGAAFLAALAGWIGWLYVPGIGGGAAQISGAAARLGGTAGRRLSGLGTASLVCAVAAVSLPIAARVVAGPRGAIIDIRWQEATDTAARQQLEARFRLTDRLHLGGTTWQYDLVNPSRDILQAIVTHPDVDDTQDIDRVRFALNNADRTSRRSRFAAGDAVVLAADIAALLLVAFIARHTLLGIGRAAAAPALWAPVVRWIVHAETHAWAYALLLLLGLAMYAGALWFPLANGDDVSYLQAVSTVGNPLVYFIGGHGVDNDLYRPLTPVSLWVTYKTFGVWGVPHQLVNLILHFANTVLLYKILRRARADAIVACLFAAVFMISKYTWVSATFVADRPMVWTGLFVLLFLYHVAKRDDAPAVSPRVPMRIGAVVALTILALMSKESGIVIAGVAFAFAVVPWTLTPPPLRYRLRLALTAVAIVGLYIGFRILIFGPRFASYTQDGYVLLGAIHYQHAEELSPLLRYVSYGENVLKNAMAPLLPIFAEGGALMSRQAVLASLPVIVSTAALFAMTAGRQLTRLQWVAALVILANAVAHYVLFRFRLHYLSHAAFCIFVGSSPIFAAAGGRGKAAVARALGIVVLGGSIVWTTYMFDDYRLQRNLALENLKIDGVSKFGPIVEEILDQYR